LREGKDQTSSFRYELILRILIWISYYVVNCDYIFPLQLSTFIWETFYINNGDLENTDLYFKFFCAVLLPLPPSKPWPRLSLGQVSYSFLLGYFMVIADPNFEIRHNDESVKRKNRQISDSLLLQATYFRNPR
jgi:hypothetical protein